MVELVQNEDKTPDLKFSLFLGCVIPNRYPMIEKASRSVFKEMSIEILEMEGASCCPAPGVFRSVDKAIWLIVGARNLNIAQKKGTDILTLCNGCYGTLLEVDHTLKHNKEMNSRINELLSEVGRQYDGSINVKHVMDVLYNDIGLVRMQSLVKKKLNLKVAVHYGCHLLKPSEIRPFGDDPDNPRFFDNLIETTGCESIDYQEKFQCCGAGGGVRTGMKEISLKFTLDKLRQIRKAGADCIVTCCPFCHLQFDLGQIEVKDMLLDDEEPFSIPVLYVTQLLGLAMGLEPKDLGMIKPTDLKNITPFTSLEPILKKVQEVSNETTKRGNI
ncbi:MAG: CoB--CoM heterodisulfide reductase subunit B [archaeon]|nr:CoB--CoM heterodisulfide reductase subunit B [archaeon]